MSLRYPPSSAYRCRGTTNFGAANLWLVARTQHTKNTKELLFSLPFVCHKFHIYTYLLQMLNYTDIIDSLYKFELSLSWIFLFKYWNTAQILLFIKCQWFFFFPQFALWSQDCLWPRQCRVWWHCPSFQKSTWRYCIPWIHPQAFARPIQGTVLVSKKVFLFMII